MTEFVPSLVTRTHTHSLLTILITTVAEYIMLRFVTDESDDVLLVRRFCFWLKAEYLYYIL